MTFSTALQSSLGWDGHLLLLHRSERERRVGLAAWVRSGLEHDEKVVYGEPQSRPGARSTSVLEILAQQGVDIDKALNAGRLEIHPPWELLVPAETQAMIAGARHTGARALRISFEVAATPMLGAPTALLTLERSFDDLCGRSPLSVLCQYDQNTMSAARLQMAADTHVTGVRSQQLNTAGTEGGIVLAGDLDISNGDLLTSVLRAACEKASERLVLGLSQVTFLSVVAARTLVESTQRFRDGGGKVTLVSPPADTEWFLRALGFDQMADVELKGAV